ncbi:wall-associated receptor kinase 2-like [Musa acuminata AAA Group]|uniref:wall-associated receptor kinase 2-like n=1 Tax=Musa acuminata AAA Group TaxID=214697 RepID=UPI0031DBF7EB
METMNPRTRITQPQQHAMRSIPVPRLPFASPLPSLLLLLIASTAPSSPAENTSLPGCPSACGDVHIPYPFGIGANCSRDGFTLTCAMTTTDGGSYKPFLADVEIIDISLSSGQARVYNHISWQCYDGLSGEVVSRRWSLDFTDRPYRFSDGRNRFTTIGCDTLAYIKGHKDGDSYRSGCVSVCDDAGSLANGSCSGIGCCQTAIPRGMSYYEVSFAREFNNSKVWRFDPCSYAVLVDEDWFEFRTSYVTSDELSRTEGGRVPLVVDWAIGEDSCEEARRDRAAYACISKHSECANSTNGPGYLCNCSSGYQGNPYLQNGCQDIDECALKEKYPCFGVCTNKQGRYNCVCPPGTQGDPFRPGACYPESLSLAVKLIIGISTSLVFLLLFGLIIYIMHGRRKIKRIKEAYFKQNGGWLLLEEMKSQQGPAFKIFTREELESATDKFDKNHILGGGGHGTVYRGILKDDRTVAIKKSMMVNESQKKEFVKEMLILSQTNHKNIVKLLGCCLEVEIPMLVYEFVSRGSLFQFIHENNQKSTISLDARLKIALETAEALAYLHSSASPPILHGDVKSSNILLDESYTAKVSDFGASMLVPINETQFATLVQGTCGYLDPEYLQTCQLTDKSDVYSFGVVLLELLTGKKALYLEESNTERSLALSFILAMKDDRLLEFLDYQVGDEAEVELVQHVAKLANECLSVRGEERPTMKEVATELGRLAKLKQWSSIEHIVTEAEHELHPWIQHGNEIEHLLGE